AASWRMSLSSVRSETALRSRLFSSPPWVAPARPERRPAATSRRSLQACIASLPLRSALMRKTYLKSDHFNGGGSWSSLVYPSFRLIGNGLWNFCVVNFCTLQLLLPFSLPYLAWQGGKPMYRVRYV